ncbi:hypothetical protein WJX73_007216 [Symbiochloris irregularis]|uniref:Uncharacterized protein n=1 Tax=Symbiochloris irregularis TaxID=706552 RepID=A0AAW1NNP4_9CHLO
MQATLLYELLSDLLVDVWYVCRIAVEIVNDEVWERADTLKWGFAITICYLLAVLSALYYGVGLEEYAVELDICEANAALAYQSDVADDCSFDSALIPAYWGQQSDGSGRPSKSAYQNAVQMFSALCTYVSQIHDYTKA